MWYSLNSLCRLQTVATTTTDKSPPFPFSSSWSWVPFRRQQGRIPLFISLDFHICNLAIGWNRCCATIIMLALPLTPSPSSSLYPLPCHENPLQLGKRERKKRGKRIRRRERERKGGKRKEEQKGKQKKKKQKKCRREAKFLWNHLIDRILILIRFRSIWDI